MSFVPASTQIFYTCLPHQNPFGGDVAYQSILSAAVNELDETNSTCLTFPDKLAGSWDAVRTGSYMKARKSLRSRGTFKEDWAAYCKDPNGIELVSNLLQPVLETEKSSILHLQLRPPGTGLVLVPSDLQAIRERGVKVVVTCHEFWTLRGTRTSQNSSSHTCRLRTRWSF